MVEAYFAILGGLAIVLGLASRPLREAPVSEPLVALLAGVLFGPSVLGAIELAEAVRLPVLATAAEVSLAFAIMASTLRFTTAQVRRRLPALVLLLTVGLLAMGAITWLVAVVALGLPAVTAVVLGAALAPTDPVLAANAVTGDKAERDLSLRVRLLLSIESAANDGLAHVLVMIGLALAVDSSLLVEGGVGAAEVVSAAAIGAGMGWVAGRMVVWADRHHEMEHSAFLVLTLSLTLLVLGLVEVIGATGIVAVLATGLVYSHQVTDAERREEWEIQEAVNQYLVLPVFALLGVALPWDAWGDLGFQALAFVLGVLVLRRLPMVLALARPLRLSWPEAGFVGWFGPVGVAALYYLATAVEDGAVDGVVWAAGTLAIAASTVAHGVTAAPARRRLGRARDGSEGQR